ncbi:hypothetical protein PBRA_001263 [Plasmodiophora brassicae]|uniref:Uncharacterized protein n=1 Tax=Plasmodiophora brassicae TaxID=37360 RepID=A0A0G4IVT8_PLABS|nr:hypothetical protein PBRA_001263 [Plasmodiophora brassicae]
MGVVAMVDALSKALQDGEAETRRLECRVRLAEARHAVATAENDSARATGQRLGRLVQEMAPVVAIIDDMRCRRADKERAAALVSGRLKTRRHRIVAVESETSSIRVRRDLLHEKHAATMNVLVQERGAREREISYLKQQYENMTRKVEVVRVSGIREVEIAKQKNAEALEQFMLKKQLSDRDEAIALQKIDNLAKENARLRQEHALLRTKFAKMSQPAADTH